MLARHQCLFGGGTAITLSHGEYRESADLDFLVSDRQAYAELRRALTAAGSLVPITRMGASLPVARQVRADQYGVRTMVVLGETEIKLEIVYESRIALEAPRASDRICGVASLTLLDMTATKLLANSDRWADDGVFSRDLIDLAMLDAPKKLRQRALEKASDAYGDSIARDLARAIERLRERSGRLDECMSALKIDGVPKAVLWNRIRQLHPRR